MRCKPNKNAVTNIKLYQRTTKKPKSMPKDGSHSIAKKLIFYLYSIFN